MITNYKTSDFTLIEGKYYSPSFKINKIDDLVTIDQATGTLLKKENNTVYNGLDSVTYYYNVVYLIEDVVSFNFIPSDYTEDQIYAIRRCWNEDH